MSLGKENGRFALDLAGGKVNGIQNFYARKRAAQVNRPGVPRCFEYAAAYRTAARVRLAREYPPIRSIEVHFTIVKKVAISR
jgi:hypothetical protein